MEYSKIWNCNEYVNSVKELINIEKIMKKINIQKKSFKKTNNYSTTNSTFNFQSNPIQINPNKFCIYFFFFHQTINLQLTPRSHLDELTGGSAYASKANPPQNKAVVKSKSPFLCSNELYFFISSSSAFIVTTLLLLILLLELESIDDNDNDEEDDEDVGK